MRSTSGTSVSACQTTCGASPVTFARTSTVSRSRFEAGKTMTADFIARTSGKTSRLQLDLVFLDDGVGEKLLAHLFQLRAGSAFALLGELDVDHLALADLAHRRKAEIVERMPDGLPLQIEHARLQGDEDSSLHRTNTGPLFSPWIDSGRIPKRRATSE